MLAAELAAITSTPTRIAANVGPLPGMCANFALPCVSCRMGDFVE